MSLAPQDAIIALYKSHSANSNPAGIAQAAYDEALKNFKQELGSNGQMAWLNGHTTMADVLSAVGQVRLKAYPADSSWTKISGGLDKISSRIIFYGGVLDALSQHHPEYVALAWGAMKFVLMGLLNHGELLDKFAKAFVEIGDALNFATCSALIYGTLDIEATISQLYLQIMRFLSEAVHWYSKRPIQRVLSAIVNPWELKYKDCLEGIRSCVARVKDHAVRASWAELRVVHDNVTTQGTKLDNVEVALSALQLKCDEIRRLLEHQLQVNLNHRDISLTMRQDMDEVRPAIRDLQVRAILDGLRPDLDIDPDQNLLQMQIVMKRKNNAHGFLQNGDHLRRCIEQWFNEPASSLLVARVPRQFKSMAKAPLLDLIRAIQSSTWPAFFVLSKTTLGTSTDHSVLLSTWIKAVIHQVMSRNPDCLLRLPGQLQSVQYCTDHSPGEWMHLLGQLLMSFPRSCLILDTSDLFEQYHDNPDTLQHLIHQFRGLIESVRTAQGYMKVFILYYGSQMPVKPPQGTQFREHTCSLQYKLVPARLRAQHASRTTAQRNRLRRFTKSKPI